MPDPAQLDEVRLAQERRVPSPEAVGEDCETVPLLGAALLLGLIELVLVELSRRGRQIGDLRGGRKLTDSQVARGGTARAVRELVGSEGKACWPAGGSAHRLLPFFVLHPLCPFQEEGTELLFACIDQAASTIFLERDNWTTASEDFELPATQA